MSVTVLPVCFFSLHSLVFNKINVTGREGKSGKVRRMLQAENRGREETITCHLCLNVFLTLFPVQRQEKATPPQPPDPAARLRLSTLKMTPSRGQQGTGPTGR